MTLCERCEHKNICNIRDCHEEGDERAMTFCSDFFEIIRCEECMWWEVYTYGSTIGRCENPRNGLTKEYSEDSNFCSYGKRRNESEK